MLTSAAQEDVSEHCKRSNMVKSKETLQLFRLGVFCKTVEVNATFKTQ